LKPDATAARRRTLSHVGKEPRNLKSQLLMLRLLVWPWVSREARRGLGEQTWRGSVRRAGVMCQGDAAEAQLLSSDVPSEEAVGLDLSM